MANSGTFDKKPLLRLSTRAVGFLQSLLGRGRFIWSLIWLVSVLAGVAGGFWLLLDPLPMIFLFKWFCFGSGMALGLVGLIWVGWWRYSPRAKRQFSPSALIRWDDLGFLLWFMGHHLLWVVILTSTLLFLLFILGPTPLMVVLTSGALGAGLWLWGSLLIFRYRPGLGLCWTGFPSKGQRGFWLHAFEIMTLKGRYRYIRRRDLAGQKSLLRQIDSVFDLKRVGRNPPLIHNWGNRGVNAPGAFKRRALIILPVFLLTALLALGMRLLAAPWLMVALPDMVQWHGSARVFESRPLVSSEDLPAARREDGAPLRQEAGMSLDGGRTAVKGLGARTAQSAGALRSRPSRLAAGTGDNPIQSTKKEAATRISPSGDGNSTKRSRVSRGDGLKTGDLSPGGRVPSTNSAQVEAGPQSKKKGGSFPLGSTGNPSSDSKTAGPSSSEGGQAAAGDAPSSAFPLVEADGRAPSARAGPKGLGSGFGPEESGKSGGDVTPGAVSSSKAAGPFPPAGAAGGKSGGAGRGGGRFSLGGSHGRVKLPVPKKGVGMVVNLKLPPMEGGLEKLQPEGKGEPANREGEKAKALPTRVGNRSFPSQSKHGKQRVPNWISEYLSQKKEK